MGKASLVWFYIKLLWNHVPSWLMRRCPGMVMVWSGSGAVYWCPAPPVWTARCWPVWSGYGGTYLSAGVVCIVSRLLCPQLEIVGATKQLGHCLDTALHFAFILQWYDNWVLFLLEVFFCVCFFLPHHLCVCVWFFFMIYFPFLPFCGLLYLSDFKSQK